ncbi:MAG: hypothetical protein HC837_09020 [Chloroflexaceae bacterium]|nr:hypothetical protein [Chloroflexaceae bacterium]
MRRLSILLFILFTTMLLVTSISRPTLAQSDERCFEATGYCISGRLRAFWEASDGLRVFGLPLSPQQTETIEGWPVQVQWFERNRLELHPDQPPPYDVLLGRLGNDCLAQQNRDWFTFPQSTPQDGCQFFAATGQRVCAPFLEAWRANGIELDGQPGFSEVENLALFGLPISQPITETLSDGNAYQVQWFERARFEYHPEQDPAFQVLFGLLGHEVRRGCGIPVIAPPRQTHPVLVSPTRSTVRSGLPVVSLPVRRSLSISVGFPLANK